MKAHNKLIENSITQIAQQLSQLNKSSGQFPGQTEQPPMGHINAITTRNGRELQELDFTLITSILNVENHEDDITAEKVIEEEAVEEEKKEPIVAPIKPYVPPVLFPQRLAQATLEKKYGKFLGILQKLYIYIPFLDVISEMPSYAKFLKDISSWCT
ncbi:uncharacterized protein LOC141666215 [Apium graveolens]|uniref:uncharacterized protein LOC141666215 n=1 Tax=Apium graveolens TaxID=4045 RepID=UPI003D7B9B16